MYLSLKGVVYPNNSNVNITEIGQTDTTSVPRPPNSNNGLQCITDKRQCCAAMANRAGVWLFPENGGMVPPIGEGANRATTFYRNRGDDGTVNLNRVNDNVMMPTGQFCCMVPDATDAMVTVCVNIGR